MTAAWLLSLFFDQSLLLLDQNTMRRQATTKKKVDRTRKSPPAAVATRASNRVAARNASKSIHEDSPVGRAENRSKRKEAPKAVKAATNAAKKTKQAAPGRPPRPAVADLNESAMDTPPVAVVEAPVPVEKKKATNNRNSNYRSTEDMWLCKAHTHCTHDSIKGVDQRSLDFWTKVAVEYETQRVARKEKQRQLGMGFALEKRDPMSLRNRWTKKLLPSINKFIAIYSRIEEKKPSGTTEKDWIYMACRQYHNRYNSPFNFVDQWQYLKDKGKFKVPQEVLLEEEESFVEDQGDGNQSVAVSQLGFSSVSSKKKGQANRIIAYSNTGRPMGRDFAKKLAKEELKIDSESSSFASAIPSLKSSIDEMTGVMQQKAQEKSKLAKHLKKQSQKQFKFDGFMKMAEFYSKNNNEEKAEQYVAKAMALMDDVDDDDESLEDGDKKMPAKDVVPEGPEENDEGKETDSVDTDELIRNITRSKAEESEEVKKIKNLMSQYEFSQEEEEYNGFYDDPDDADDDLSFIPVTEFPDGHRHNTLLMDRGLSQPWFTWRTVKGKEYHFVEEEQALEYDDQASSALLSDEEDEEEKVLAI